MNAPRKPVRLDLNTLRADLDAIADWIAPGERVLDLGCGTGLSGVAFKPIARRLVGIDLSPKMLAKAQELAIYDALAEGDAEAPPAGAEGPFDLIVAGDVLDPRIRY